ncbi:hypothetical protein [Okeania sp. SIO3B5]|nr:hypothetical protein [Okeania sp. SIO3B5]
MKIFLLLVVGYGKVSSPSIDRFYPLQIGGFQPQFFGNALRIID